MSESPGPDTPATPEPSAEPPTEKTTAPVVTTAPADKKAPAKVDKKPPADKKPRVAVTNRADGGVVYWIGKLYGFAALVALVVAGLTVLMVYRYFTTTTPSTPDLRDYARITPGVTRVYAADGTVLGEFAREWREITPYESIPPRLIDAVVAIEDHEFFEHGGIYFKGIARAAWANVTAGDFAQGGSTITQQVAKQFLGSDKSLARKAREAIMARRLEARYSKKAILSLYLNHIYLGAGAYGVAAAAHRYFQKDLEQLTLAEMALLAGLPKAPSAFSPLSNPARALERRNLVLDQMVRWGKLEPGEAEVAKAEPLALNVYRDVFPDRMPYFAEYVRRYIKTTYGEDALMAGGLRVEAAVEPTFDAAAYDNVDYGTHRQDKRQGWRGPEWFVDGSARATLIERQKTRYGTGPLEPRRRYLAVVDEVKCDGAKVIVGDRTLDLPLRNMKWASPWSATDADNDKEISCATKALRAGDVVWVQREIRTRGRYREFYMPDNINPAWQTAQDEHEWDEKHPDVVILDQVPHPQGAIFSADHRTGYVQAMVGGTDFTRSEIDRTHGDRTPGDKRDPVLACRQPGSTYKPIYYSAALDIGFGFDSMFYDKPVEIIDEVTGEVWTPGNFGGSVDSDVTLEYALVFSKNIPSVGIFSEVGAEQVKAWARKLGFTSEIIADKALALGASCTYLDELTRAFAIFARNGQWIDWTWVRRVVDRSGNVLEDHTVPYDPVLAPGDRLDRMAAVGGVKPRQAIPARTAYLTTKLLAHMVTYGFTKTLRATDIHAAGKTGTSSATMDNSFVAFTSRHITTVWLGDDDRVRELGKKDAAYMTVVPVWARYTYATARNFPNLEIPWSVPEGVNPRDRGDHSRGRKGPQMPLIYRHGIEKPEAPPDGALVPPPPA